MDEKIDWWSQVTFTGTNKCPKFVPHWLAPYRCGACSHNIFTHEKESVQKEEYVQAAVEFKQAGPSKILRVGDAALYHGGYKCITSSSIMNDKSIRYVCNTAKGLEKVFGKKLIEARKRHEENGIEFMDLELLDSPKQELPYDTIHKALIFIHEGLYVHKQSVLVNCAQGKSRSASIVVAYLMAIEDLGYKEALVKVKKQRAMAEPNFGFARQLKEWKASEDFKKIQLQLSEISS